MQFLMMILGDANYEAGRAPDPRLAEAVGRHTEEMMRAGVVLGVGGLLPTSAGARVRLRRGRVKVTDGPFAEAKEIVGGYAVVRADSKREAIGIAERFLRLHEEVLGPGYEGECVIRQMHEMPEPGAPGARR